MDKGNILKAIEELKKEKQRKFPQSYDLIINLKNLDVKKEANKFDNFLVLPNDKGKKLKICALIDKELAAKSKEIFDKAILADEFSKLNKKDIKKLANEHDFFVAQSSIMTDVAKTFGKILGPKNKMPNPKAGAVITSATDLKSLYVRLQKTVRLTVKNEASIKTMIGKQGMEDKLPENVMAVYNNVLHSLPQEKYNIKNVILKLTMSKGVKVES